MAYYHRFGTRLHPRATLPALLFSFLLLWSAVLFLQWGRTASLPSKRAPVLSQKCAATDIPVKWDEWGAQTFELLFHREDIPGSSDQQTKTGKMILTLMAFDGRLHLGYGDEDANTGPIPMHAWDPLEQRWVAMGTIESEEVRILRLGDNREALYAPVIDGHGSQADKAVGVYRLVCGGDGWKAMGNLINGSAHNYDLVLLQQPQQNSKVLVATGSRTNEPAFLMASDDLGETWTEAFRQESKPGSYTRIYNAGATNDLIFISGRDSRAHTSFAYTSIGSTNNTNNTAAFQPITNLEIAKRNDSVRPPYLVPIVLHDEIVVTSYTDVPPYGRHLGSYRIEGTELVQDKKLWLSLLDSSDGKEEETRVLCWTIDSSSDPYRLLVLVQQQDSGRTAVFRTKSLQRDPVWERVLLLDQSHDFSAMALLRNDLYLGTTHGNLYIVREVYKQVVL